MICEDGTTANELLAEAGWRSEALDEDEYRQPRRVFDASGTYIGMMTAPEVRSAIASGSCWTHGMGEYVRVVNGETLAVYRVRDRDNSDGIAEPGGWRFVEDGLDPPVPYYGAHDARHVLHDSPEEAMHAADEWLKAVR